MLLPSLKEWQDFSIFWTNMFSSNILIVWTASFLVKIWLDKDFGFEWVIALICSFQGRSVTFLIIHLVKTSFYAKSVSKSSSFIRRPVNQYSRYHSKIQNKYFQLLMIIILYVFSVPRGKLISIMKLNLKKNISLFLFFFCFVSFCFLGGRGCGRGVQLDVIYVDVAVIKSYLRTSTPTK